jgi:hypothetical protein
VSNGNLSRVAWSRDRRLLYAGGHHRDRIGIHLILQWSQAGRGAATTLAASTNTIRGLHPLAHGRLVFGAADPAFGVFDANGSRVRARGPETVDYRDRHTMLRVSDDGGVVEFGFDTLTSDNRTNRHLARLRLAEGRVFHSGVSAGSWSGGGRQRQSSAATRPWYCRAAGTTHHRTGYP